MLLLICRFRFCLNLMHHCINHSLICNQKKLQVIICSLFYQPEVKWIDVTSSFKSKSKLIPVSSVKFYLNTTLSRPSCAGEQLGHPWAQALWPREPMCVPWQLCTGWSLFSDRVEVTHAAGPPGTAGFSEGPWASSWFAEAYNTGTPWPYVWFLSYPSLNVGLLPNFQW